MTTTELDAKRAEAKSLWAVYEAARNEAEARRDEWLAVHNEVRTEEAKLVLLEQLKAEGRLG